MFKEKLWTEKRQVKGRLGHMIQIHDCHRLVCRKSGPKSLYFLNYGARAHSSHACEPPL